MVLTTTFLLGAMFLVLNAALIRLLIKPDPVTSAREILLKGVLPFWEDVFQSGEGIFTGFLFLVISLIVGLLLTPIDRAITAIFGSLWGFISGLTHKIVWKMRKRPAPKPAVVFTSLVFTQQEYPAFIAWLMTKREAKLHWEWELFKFYVFWSVFTNIAIFVALCAWLQWPVFSTSDELLYVCLLVLFLGFAVSHCGVMARVNQHYWQLYKGPQRKTSRPNS